MSQDFDLHVGEYVPVPFAFSKNHLAGEMDGGRKQQLSPEELAGSEGIRLRLATRGRTALTLLLEAREYAQEMQCNAWDFAVPAVELFAGGLNCNDLRWLIYRKLVVATDGDCENPVPGPQQPNVPWAKEPHYVLTKAGTAFVESVLQQMASPPATSLLLAGPPLSVTAKCPRWDSSRQGLYVGEILVKQYKVPAANQEKILAVFEEESWPPRIDDPLPGVEESRRKRRLHDTINSLNRGQRSPLMRFLGDGKGEGVRWELRRPSEFGTLFSSDGA